MPLPPEAHAFLGTWNQKSVENYDAFLSDSVGLTWALRKVAMRIKPKPTWSLEEGGRQLRCRVEMLGAKPIVETYGGGVSATGSQPAGRLPA